MILTAGMALTDDDRARWLARLHDLMGEVLARGGSGVLACSALKAAYRAVLAQGLPGVRFVYLRADRELIRVRLRNRTGHFMQAGMLESQFATLEEPADALTVDAALAPDEIVKLITRSLR